MISVFCLSVTLSMLDYWLYKHFALIIGPRCTTIIVNGYIYSLTIIIMFAIITMELPTTYYMASYYTCNNIYNNSNS